jgi:hypothetical protein
MIATPVWTDRLAIAVPPQQPSGQQQLGGANQANLGLRGEVPACGGVEGKTASWQEGLLERGGQRS